MGFDMKNGEESQQQMSLFEMPTIAFVESKKTSSSTSASTLAPSAATAKTFDYNDWALAHKEPEQSKTPKFMTLSMTLHAAAILAMAMITVPLVEEVKKETITIELQETPAPRMQVRGSDVPATQGSDSSIPTVTVKDAPIVKASSAAAAPGDVVVATKKSKTVKIAHAAKARVAKTPKAKVAAGKTGHAVAAKTNFKAVPMTIDDINAPELDPGAVAQTKVKSEMNEDFNEDFDSVDRAHQKNLSAEKSKMDDMASAAAAEQDDELKSLQDQNKEDSARFAALQDDLHKKNSQAIASAVASETAAQEAAAREAANQQQAAAALAAARAKAKNNEGGGQGRAQQGPGAGNNGAAQASSSASGTPTGVRSLDQLRQMPGNPRPQYDREERRRGDQGAVAFVAYVNKEGYVSKFQMLKSTGYRNLDAKTLGALKKWRFYPGQEGWVELPFRWDIKGGVQEDGGRLRTRVSQN